MYAFTYVMYHRAIYILTSLNCTCTNVCKICTLMQTDPRCLLLDKIKDLFIFPYGRLTMVRGIELLNKLKLDKL